MGIVEVIGLAAFGFVSSLYVYVQSRAGPSRSRQHAPIIQSIFSISFSLFFLSTEIMLVGMLFVP